MIYCDASLIVSVLAVERFTDVARAFVRERSPANLAVSPWVRTEVASALAMKRRMGVVDDLELVEMMQGWRRLQDLLRAVPIGAERFEMAETLVTAGPRGLRAGDALHLAIAHHGGFALATFDRDLASAAEAIGVQVALRPPA